MAASCLVARSPRTSADPNVSSSAIGPPKIANHTDVIVPRTVVSRLLAASLGTFQPPGSALGHTNRVTSLILTVRLVGLGLRPLTSVHRREPPRRRRWPEMFNALSSKREFRCVSKSCSGHYRDRPPVSACLDTCADTARPCCAGRGREGLQLLEHRSIRRCPPSGPRSEPTTVDKMIRNR
jgi:hypothetical protein